MGRNVNRIPLSPRPSPSPGCPKPEIPPLPSHHQQRQLPQTPLSQSLPPQQQPPPPPPDSAKPEVPQRPGPTPRVGSAPPASGSAPPATLPTTGAPPGAPLPAPLTSAVLATPPEAGGTPPPLASNLGPGPGGPKGDKLPGEPKPGGGQGLSAPDGHPEPLLGGGWEPRGGRQHHPLYHRQHPQAPPPGGLRRDSEEMSLLRRPGEKTYTQRCRLFVGNLPADITEDEFKRLFAKYGEPREVFINKGKGFGLIKLESRVLAKIAKAELDSTPMRGRQLLVRFATHAAALSVRNLSPYVSNELLEEAFSQFGPIERAVVIVDDRGRSTGKGIVEFASKPAARKAFQRCSEGIFLLTTTPRPVIVEPLEQLNDEDGLPEKLAQKNPMYQKERETPPRFAQHGTFEYEYSQRWKTLDEMEKQQRELVEKNMKDAKEKLENEMEDVYREHQANYLHQGLMSYQEEEMRHMEELHNQKMQTRKQMQLRQEEKRCRREEEMMIGQCKMEEQMRHQREESYSQMGCMDPRERDVRMGGGGVVNMGDAHGSGSQKCPPLGGGGGIGSEANARVPPATLSGSMMGSDKSTEPFGQEEGAEMLIRAPEKEVCHHDGSNSGTQTPVQKIEDHSIIGGATATAALKPQRKKRIKKRKQPSKDALNFDTPTWAQIKGLTNKAQDVIKSQGAIATPALLFMTMLAIVSCQSAASLCDPSSSTPVEIHELWLNSKEEEDTENE